MAIKKNILLAVLFLTQNSFNIFAHPAENKNSSLEDHLRNKPKMIFLEKIDLSVPLDTDQVAQRDKDCEALYRYMIKYIELMKKELEDGVLSEDNYLEVNKNDFLKLLILCPDKIKTLKNQ